MESWGGKTTPTAELIDMASTNLIRNAMYAGKNLGEECAELQHYSIRKQLVTDVVFAATAHALQSGMDVHEFEDLASSGISIVNGIQYALTEHHNFIGLGTASMS